MIRIPYRNLVVIFLAFVAGCATPIRTTSESGAGYLVVALGATPTTHYSSYSLLYRELHGPGKARVMYLEESLFKAPKVDFADASEHGAVFVQQLAPGDYEIYNFDVFRNGGMFQYNYKSPADFSIPFTIRSGTATYLGDFRAHQSFRKPFTNVTVGTGVYFVLTDQRERDLPIAKGKLPSIERYEMALPDPALVANPLLRAAAVD